MIKTAPDQLPSYQTLSTSLLSLPLTHPLHPPPLQPPLPFSSTRSSDDGGGEGPALLPFPNTTSTPCLCTGDAHADERRGDRSALFIAYSLVSHEAEQRGRHGEEWCLRGRGWTVGCASWCHYKGWCRGCSGLVLGSLIPAVAAQIRRCRRWWRRLAWRARWWSVAGKEVEVEAVAELLPDLAAGHRI
uniref:Uncharacterized protein n=1 Tax=Oryza punctata TaxID=4537 RepID=A0A0E0L1M6_ORYPU